MVNNKMDSSHNIVAAAAGDAERRCTPREGLAYTSDLLDDSTLGALTIMAVGMFLGQMISLAVR
jgi:hypothetical protein